MVVKAPSRLADLRERFPRVAVVHDWLTVPGGSEHVVLQLLEMFPVAELFTSIYDPVPWPAQITERRVHVSFLNRIPGAHRAYPWLLPLMSRAFEGFDLSGFDLVLSSSHAFSKSVRTPAGALHVCYCHTPMRYAWDPGFLAGERLGPAKLVLSPLLRRMRRQDLRGAGRPDAFVANSQHVADRIRRHYARGSSVVHPPVDVVHFLTLERDPDHFYLVFGRVVPYKRPDLAVAACAALRRPVVIAGDGRAMAAARSAAGPQARFLGHVSDEQRDALLRRARAVIFAGEEDFGIVPVEAQAAGVPVIAYGMGGANETIRDGQTGVLFAEQTVESLAGAIERLDALHLDPGLIRDNARRFGRERFQREMAAAIEAAADVHESAMPSARWPHGGASRTVATDSSAIRGPPRRPGRRSGR